MARWMFIGGVTVFNGRYPKTHSVRTNATTWPMAFKEACKFVLDMYKGTRRIQEVTIKLVRTGRVAEAENANLFPIEESEEKSV